MQIVNGYVCDCQSDARLAKRGIDPANPHNDPFKQQQLDAGKGVADPGAVDAGKPGDFDPNRQNGAAVVFGGALSGETRTGTSSTAPAPLVDLLA
jgi:hypothetical protein